MSSLREVDVAVANEVKAEAAAANKVKAEAANANVGANEAKAITDQVVDVAKVYVEALGKDLLDVKERMVKLTMSVEEGLGKILDMLGAQDKRLKAVELFVESHNVGSDFGFDDSCPRSRYGGGTYGGTCAGVTVIREGLEKDVVDKESGAGDGDGQEKEKEKESDGKRKGKEIVTDGEEEFESCDEDGEDVDMEDGEDVDMEAANEAEAAQEGVVVGEKRISKPFASFKSPYVLMMP